MTQQVNFFNRFMTVTYTRHLLLDTITYVAKFLCHKHCLDTDTIFFYKRQDAIFDLGFYKIFVVFYPKPVNWADHLFIYFFRNINSCNSIYIIII